jgi:hypothetical protein
LNSLFNVGGVSQASSSAGANFTLGSAFKSALSYTTGASGSASLGNAGTATTPASLPLVSDIALGRQTTSSKTFLYGYLQGLTYWPKKISDPALPALTQ